ncbi:MAG: hemerythrin domain-containing protein [Bacteroidota bacterium]|nr:hemerythrin domain-containing protein [Bacteroidota bacterium]MDX5429793.1 hemerythrin domain-containing protein [Bacteroidota bacterium]MDX5468572.1 hemerythrin domain-containing protein [Bacteroidota bacterium]
MQIRPIKRHFALQPVSREHHHSLLTCWKIRQGVEKHIETQRIQAYTHWYYRYHIKPHLELEERHIFPILGTDDEIIQKVLLQHRELERLFEIAAPSSAELLQLAYLLQEHVRFEERILFKRIQEEARPEALQDLLTYHQEQRIVDKLDDPFWEKTR